MASKVFVLVLRFALLLVFIAKHLPLLAIANNVLVPAARFSGCLFFCALVRDFAFDAT